MKDQRLPEIIRQTRRDNFEAYGYRKMWKTLGRSGESAQCCQSSG